MAQQHKKGKPNKHLAIPEAGYVKDAEYDEVIEEEEAKLVKINNVVKSIPPVKKKIRHEKEENAFTASENKETAEQEDRKVKRYFLLCSIRGT